MIKRIAAFFILLYAGAWCLQRSDAQVLFPTGSPVTCSQATNLIARMDGSQNTSAITTLICGMVTDTTYQVLDSLYVFATNSAGNAALNWAQNAFNVTVTGSCTFTANVGYTGDAATCFLKAGYIPSTAAGNLTQNSASVGACILNSRTAGSTGRDLSVQTGSTSIYIQALDGSNVQFGSGVNDLTFGNIANTNAQGSWINSRTAGANFTVYKNGASAGTITAASVGLPTNEIYILANNNAGTANVFSGDQLGYVFWGGSLSAAQAATVYYRLRNYLQAVGVTPC